MNRYDVVIIGTGAGGGTLARQLAPSGKRILLLERGGWLPREIQNWTTADVFVDNRYISPDTWRDEHGKAFQPQVHYFIGGATKFYGAALYRLRREDFGELRHYDGVSPAWPIGYDEMEPYYARAERLYNVHGAHGEDPTEPASSEPFPFPAVSHEPRIQRLADDLTAAGYHPFHAPCGIMLDEANPPYSHAYLKTAIPIAAVAHQAGTCRFGTDPATSVLDVDCRAHEVDNLYVVDTSFFPSIGAVNPALTAIANAIRVADRLLERLGASTPEAVSAR